MSRCTAAESSQVGLSIRMSPKAVPFTSARKKMESTNDLCPEARQLLDLYLTALEDFHQARDASSPLPLRIDCYPEISDYGNPDVCRQLVRTRRAYLSHIEQHNCRTRS